MRIDGKWSIAENIAHLGRYQEVCETRFNIIIGAQSPIFERYVAEKDEGFINWLNRGHQCNLEKLKEHREKIVDKMLSYQQGQFQKKGTHPLYGNMSLMEWVYFFVFHECHHLYTIFKLKCRLGTI